MARVDLIVRGGRVVLGGEVIRAHLLVQDGKVVGILDDDMALPKARDVVPAEGKYVLPGVIDPHVHFRDPGHPEWEDFESGTRAAAAGGITTCLEMPISDPPVYDAAVFRRRAERVESRALVDIGLYGGAGSDNLDEIAALAAAGVVGFKTFMHAPPGDRESEYRGLTVHEEFDLLRIFQAVAATGLVAAVHAETNSFVVDATRRLQEASRNDPPAHPLGRPVLAELDAIQRCLLLAGEAGVRLHIVHLSTGSGGDLLCKARRSGGKVTVETCPHYLFLTDEAMTQFGVNAKINPPVRVEAERAKLWEHLRRGTIDVIGSDHAPFDVNAKRRGEGNIWAAPSGAPLMEATLPLLLTEVVRGQLTLPRAVELLATNAARIFGLSHCKGAIRIGGDADLVVVDLNAEQILDSSRWQTRGRAVANLYDGRRVTGVPEHTLVRGRLVWSGGKIVSEPGWGRVVQPVRNQTKV